MLLVIMQGTDHQSWRIAVELWDHMVWGSPLCPHPQTAAHCTSQTQSICINSFYFHNVPRIIPS